MCSLRSNSLDPVVLDEWRWHPFLEKTIKSFSLFNLKPCLIEDHFLNIENNLGSNLNTKKVQNCTWMGKSSKLRMARAVCLEAPKIASVLNFVAVPFEKFDLPFLGADFVTLPNGHLIALDLQPALKNDIQHTEEVWDRLIPIQKHWQGMLPSGGSIPSEAKPYFSPGFLWTRIPLGMEGDQLISEVISNAYNDYLSLYIELVVKSEEVNNERSLEIFAGQKRYMRYRSEKDPARKMLRTFFGEEWAEDYINNVLFNLS